MSTTDILDFDALLAPIAGDNPAGEDLRADIASPYLKIRDSFRAARAAERKLNLGSDGDGQNKAHIPEWRVIQELASELIATRSKDLELACYLTDALVRTEGVAGLRDGFRLIRHLVRDFWDGLYPLEDEDGLETKLFPLIGLLGEGDNAPLCQTLRKLPLTEKGNPDPFSIWHHSLAQKLNQNVSESERQRLDSMGAPSLEEFERTFNLNSIDFLKDLVVNLEESVEQLNGMADELAERCSGHAPTVSAVREVLESILGLARTLGADKLAMAASLGELSSESIPVNPASGEREVPGSTVRMGAIASRDQAFTSLLEVASFFRRTEPQSFIPSMLENVVRRGRMTLPELIKDLVPNDDARQDIFLRAGVLPPTSTDG
ncbi:MAG: type VI secretion system protein TssA [Magnetococcus sp. DMHC-1]